MHSGSEADFGHTRFGSFASIPTYPPDVGLRTNLGHGSLGGGHRGGHRTGSYAEASAEALALYHRRQDDDVEVIFWLPICFMAT
jgi:hypothetical protein